MAKHETSARTTSLRLALLAPALVSLLGAGLIAGLDETTRAWMLTAGFVLLVPVVALSPRRTLAPIAVAVVFVVYGGCSALVAIPESAEQRAQHARGLSKDQIEASKRSPEFAETGVSEADAFEEAAFLTALAGLAGIGGAYLAGAYWRRRRPAARGEVEAVRTASPGRMEMAGRGLVAVAFVGVAAALARFALTQIPTDDLHMAVKSFWQGGSYFLLVATFAIPGFGLWLQGLIARGARRGEMVRLGAWMFLYIALLVPTGQRGFALALAVMVLTILFFDGYLTRFRFAAALLAGFILIGASQAARNQVREEGGVSPSGYLSRLAPGEWRQLYGTQLASFNWTMQVVQYHDVLDIPNPLPQVLLKPIPRQIYPDKSQGFGAEFTRRVYPGADEQGVSFAIPLSGESYYAFGVAGVIAAFLLLGFATGMGELRIADRAPPAVKPIVLATIGWCLFVLVRGDLANALVFAAGWVIPLLLVARSIGLRRDPEPERIVIDALQVAPEFSGIGRRVAEIGRSLREDGCPLPLTVRCAADVAERLPGEFPGGTAFHTPLRSSRPRPLRILYQQLVAPLRDSASTLLVCPGDQAPVWGRAQLVFVVHDVRRLTHPETAGGRIEAAYYRAVMTFAARRARRIVTISAFSLGEIERTLSPSCPIAIVSAHPPPQAARTAAANGSPTLLTVGALRGYKGLETVIEALSKLAADGESPLRVLCVGAEEGNDGYRESLAAYARELKVDHCFELMGWLPDEQLRDLYGRCCGTINPSTYEGYGLPVAESLADGLPTIASDIPPHREVASDAALYFEPGDAAALAAQLEAFLRDPDLREDLARRASERSQELSERGVSWAEALLGPVPQASAAPEESAVALAASR
jgi:glycosyltransferase involved in cell wall biosynthesis